MQLQMAEKIIEQFLSDSIRGKENHEYLIGTIYSPFDKSVVRDMWGEDEDSLYLESHGHQMAQEVSKRMVERLKLLRSELDLKEVEATNVMTWGHPLPISKVDLTIKCKKEVYGIAEIDFALIPKRAAEILLNLKDEEMDAEISDLIDLYIVVTKWEKENIEEATSTVMNLHQYVTRSLSGVMQ